MSNQEDPSSSSSSLINLEAVKIKIKIGERKEGVVAVEIDQERAEEIDLTIIQSFARLKIKEQGWYPILLD